MPKFELTLDIGRPSADVFAYLTDVGTLAEWQSTVVAASTDGPVRLGTRIRERRRFLGREVQTELEVPRYEPPDRLDAKARVGQCGWRSGAPRDGLTGPCEAYAAAGLARRGYNRSPREKPRREVVMLREAERTSRRYTGAEGLEPPTYGFGDRRSTN
jgi:hypothetical protein